MNNEQLIFRTLWQKKTVFIINSLGIIYLCVNRLNLFTDRYRVKILQIFIHKLFIRCVLEK